MTANESPAPSSDTADHKSHPHLAGAALASLLLAAGARPVRKGSKAIIFAQGEPATSIYFVTSGKVESKVISSQGKEGAIALLSAGDFIGEASLTLGSDYFDSAVAIADTELLVLAGEQMRLILQKNPAVDAYFTGFLLRRLQNLAGDLVDHLFNSTEKRLARVLLFLANFGGHDGRLEPIAHVTHEMLAQRVGTTRARVSHFMNKFRRLGLIEYNGVIRVHRGLLNVVLYDARPSSYASAASTSQTSYER